MKRLATLLVAVLAFIAGTVNSAVADDYYYWPEFGTLESQSDWGAKAVRAPQAQSLGATGAGVKVAFLDDGISATTPGLSHKVIAYKDFLPGNFVRAEHGTMVASTIASDYDPTVGIRGIAPGVSLIVGRVCQNSSCDNLAIRKGVAWAVEQGAQILSLSISGFTDPAMLAALKAAEQQGVLVVAAMGNSGCGPNSRWGINPYCLQGKTRESTQAGYPIPGLIAVGASDQRGGRVATIDWSSSYGPNMDLIAPGTDTSAYDSVAASNGFGGTSSATPIVAGVAALVLQMNPNLKPDEVQAILQATASKAVEEKAKVWDSCTQDPDTKAWSCNQIVDSEFHQQYFTGAGVVNAEAAVILAKQSFEQKLLDPVSLSQSNLVLTIEWDGGPADLYINSKLVSRNAISGYQYQGYLNQSVAVQLKRYQKQSMPKLAMMIDYLVPLKPVVSRAFVDADLQLRFEVNELESQIGTVWRKKNTWDTYAEYAGVFEFDDGELIACSGNNNYSETPRFTCPLQRERSLVTGKFRLISASTHLSEPSDLVSVPQIYLHPKITLSTTYQENGLPIFDWEPVAGAMSYQYRYQPEYILHCTQETTFTVPEQPAQPSVFSIQAFAGEDCTGNTLAISDSIGWTAQPAKPAKLTDIRVKAIWHEYVEFEIPNLDPTVHLRVYRSDGLIRRIHPGQPINIGVQSNEDVNGKVFSYRFVQIVMGTFAQSWSEPSDPVLVSLKALAAPKAECSEGISRFSISCDIQAVPGTQRTRIEYLDIDKNVLGSTEITNETQTYKYGKRAPRGVAFVRVAATMGDEKSRNSWYRRGESQLVEISQRKIFDSLAKAY